jgi:hypothetical protein
MAMKLQIHKMGKEFASQEGISSLIDTFNLSAII